jgi:hypothetical protein
MRRLGLFLVLLIATPRFVATQKQPDFSGEWVLVSATRSDSDAAPMLTVRQTLVRTDASGQPMAPFFSQLIVERKFVDHPRKDTYQLGVHGVRGGISGGIIGGGGVQTRYSVLWEGDRLVIETGSYSGPSRQDGPYWEHTEVWGLDREGQLVLSITDRSDKDQTSNTLTYRRN